MSLHQLARQVQAQGRDEDKLLVHMTPGEVQSLQALALANGKSLTINPKTGLPEALSLKSILPTVIGAGLAATGVGMPFAIAAGAGTGLLTSGGNLKAGIMGGLGAWGGASLVGGLMGAGAGAAAGLIPEGAAVAGAEAAGTLGNQFAYNSAGEMVASNYAPSITGAAEGTKILGTPTAGASIQEGFKQAAANPGQFFKQNMFPIGAAIAPALLSGSEQQSGIGAPPDQGQIRPYTYSQTRNPDFGKVPGAAYFDQAYTAGTPYTAATGGLVALAEGGRVDTLQLAPASSQYGPAAGSPEAQVSGLYRNVLNRRPDAAGQQFWVDALNSGASQNQVRQGFNQSPENLAKEAQRGQVADYNNLLAARANNEYNVQPAPLATLPGRGQYAGEQDVNKIINRYYQQNLARTADKPGLDFWTNAVREGALTLGGVNEAIKTSSEGVARQAAQAQSTVEENPAYKEYMSAPINRSNFDKDAYLMAHQDVARAGVDPFEHYLKHGIGEGRAVTKLPFQPTAAKPDQTGYKYDAATRTFSGGAPQPQLDLQGGFMGMDPAVLQQMYNQYQQQQQQAQFSGGGAEGGLMPNALKYNMGGGISDLGGYSDGGRLLKGPGDGVSDSIPAQIGAKQPARLADGEFVVPARIVSELGNGSTDAGARRLYAMMDRVQKKRGKTVGKNKVAVNSKAESALPV